MLDARARQWLSPALSATALRLDRLGVSPGAVTVAGLLIGVGSCLAAVSENWGLALTLWLTNRTLDGLDGPLARVHGSTDLGGMLDFVADFVVYAGFPLAVAITLPETRLAVAALLATYLLNNVALLSFSSIMEKRAAARADERSLHFTSGLVEGTETIACYAIVCLTPAHATTIFWIFAGLVSMTVLQRLALAARTLGGERSAPGP